MTGYWTINGADGKKVKVRVGKATLNEGRTAWNIGVTLPGFAKLSELQEPLRTDNGTLVTFFAEGQPA